MRSHFWFVAVVFLSVVLSATHALCSELTVKVVDPSSAAVSGAQVEVFVADSSRPRAIDITSAQGIAHFSRVPDGALRIHVLAPGFAEAWQQMSETDRHDSSVAVALKLGVATETVVVSATRTLVPEDQSGASVDLLTGAELDTMRPVAANDALRFLPGAIVSTAGQRGGLSSLFVRGGDSRYNKVLIDGVAVNDPGGTFDFGTVPLFEAERLEFLRGAQSTLYGSDAMTSVVQTWSRTGRTRVPELRFGADAGNYGTQNGYISLSGANGRFDYNVFGNQFNTNGSGPNDAYSNSLEGANLGAKLNDWASLRLRPWASLQARRQRRRKRIASAARLAREFSAASLPAPSSAVQSPITRRLRRRRPTIIIRRHRPRRLFIRRRVLAMPRSPPAAIGASARFGSKATAIAGAPCKSASNGLAP